MAFLSNFWYSMLAFNEPLLLLIEDMFFLHTLGAEATHHFKQSCYIHVHCRTHNVRGYVVPGGSCVQMSAARCIPIGSFVFTTIHQNIYLCLPILYEDSSLTMVWWCRDWAWDVPYRRFSWENHAVLWLFVFPEAKCKFLVLFHSLSYSEETKGIFTSCRLREVSQYREDKQGYM